MSGVALARCLIVRCFQDSTSTLAMRMRDRMRQVIWRAQETTKGDFKAMWACLSIRSMRSEKYNPLRAYDGLIEGKLETRLKYRSSNEVERKFELRVVTVSAAGTVLHIDWGNQIAHGPPQEHGSHSWVGQFQWPVCALIPVIVL